MSRHKKFLKFIFIKFPIFLGIVGLLMVISLKMVERFPDPLREGFQQYLSEAYGTQATIGVLEKVSFVPSIDLVGKDITMHNNANAAIIDMEIKSIAIKAPLWSMMFGQGYIDDIKIKDLQAREGFLLPKSITIESLEIVEQNGPDQFGSFVIVKGFYDQEPMEVEIELQKRGDMYKLTNIIPFSLKIGSQSLNAQMYKKFRVVELQNAVFSIEDQNSKASTFTIYKDNQFISDNPLYCILQGKDRDCSQFIQE